VAIGAPPLALSGCTALQLGTRWISQPRVLWKQVLA
jgi:hypothetical protein